MNIDWDDMEDVADVVGGVVKHLGPKESDLNKTGGKTRSKPTLIPSFFIVISVILILTALITLLLAVVKN